MNGQLIISVGREFGSGGHMIAQMLADRFSLPLYDRSLLYEIAEVKNLNIKDLEKYDEKPKMKLFSRSVNGYSNSPEENIAQIQFDYLRKKAANGESFVIVGRCAEEVLKDYDCLVTVFVLGDADKKIERIAKINNITKTEAEMMIQQQNKKRKQYHNYYSKNKWGDSRNYEISVNSSKIGFEKTADIIEDYIKMKMETK